MTTIRNFRDMDDATLDAERQRLEVDLARVKSQLQEARTRVGATGEYSDRTWYRKANDALRFMGVEHQAILREQGTRRRRATQSKAAAWERRFIEAARRRLHPDTFRELLDEAHAETETTTTP